MSNSDETWWRFEHWFKLIGIVLGAVLLGEGAASIFYLAPYTDEIGGLLQMIILPFGVSLIIIGLFILAYWLLKGTRIPYAWLSDNRWVSLLVLLAGLLLVLEAFGLAYYVSAYYGSTYIRGFWISLAAAQLFFLGMVIIFGWLSKDSQEIKTGWARILAYLSSSAIAASGLFVMGAAVPVEIGDIGVAMASTIALFGLQLFILAGIVAVIWGFKDKRLFGKNPFSHWFVQDLPLLLVEILAIEGIIIVALAVPIDPAISGIGWLNKWTVVLAGSLLFFVASSSAIAWFWKDRGGWHSRPVIVIGAMIGLVLVTEGIFIIGVAAPIVVESIGGMLASTVSLAGAQLTVIGVLLLLFWMFKGRTVFGWDITSNRIISLAPLILGVLVAIEGLVLVAYASPVELEGVGGMRGIWMTLAGMQLFLFGGVSCMLWYWRDGSPSGSSLTHIAEPLIAWAMAAEGLFIMGIAAETWIDGIGTILQRTVAIAGAQLFLLSLITIGLRLITGRGLLDRMFLGVRLTELLTYLVFAIIAIEGLAIMLLSANIYIDGFGGLSAIYVALAGAQLSLLALLGASFCVWRNADIDHQRSQYMALAIIFMVLMIPPAVLF